MADDKALGDRGLALRLSEVVASQLPGDSQATANRKAKRVHDSVWGTITLEPHEVALVDTPLLQRLRRIKQLGSSHLVFPGAVHTRFEHTLGVVHQVGRMCDGLCVKNPNAVSAEERSNLRMAALCHDLGHGPFSHNSEKFFGRMEPFAGMTRNGSLGAAERLSAMVVQSVAMRKLLAALNKAHGTSLDADFISAAILGDLSPEQAYLGEIVHGPFDADKLDYLTRDGQHCGISISVDIDRIFSSAVVVKHEHGSKRLACDSRAAAALSQLVHHKHYMNAVVYHHKVSRAFRAMCVNAFECAVAEGTPINGRPLSSPADFLALDDEMLLAPGVVAQGKALSLFSDIRERRLFKVAASYSSSDLDKETTDSIVHDPDEVRNQIADIASVPAEQVAVDAAPRVGNKEAHEMLIQVKDNKPPELLGKLMGLEETGSPLHNHLERHIVFCAAKNADVVRRAADEIFLGGRH